MFVFPASVATMTKIYVWIYDHKTLGKDRELGSGEVDVRVPSKAMTFIHYFFLEMIDLETHSTTRNDICGGFSRVASQWFLETSARV